jgi:hypothetical protein
MAIVIGATPLGTGVIGTAFSFTPPVFTPERKYSLTGC